MDFNFLSIALATLNLICVFKIFKTLDQIDEIIGMQNHINQNLLDAVELNHKQIMKIVTKGKENESI